jgi:hypothetical protein
MFSLRSFIPCKTKQINNEILREISEIVVKYTENFEHNIAIYKNESSNKSWLFPYNKYGDGLIIDFYNINVCKDYDDDYGLLQLGKLCKEIKNLLLKVAIIQPYNDRTKKSYKKYQKK